MSASWVAACQRHRSYPTREAAQAALARWRARGGAQGGPVVWKCPNGNDHYHVGRARRYRKGNRR